MKEEREILDEWEKIGDEIIQKIREGKRTRNIELGLADPSIYTLNDLGIRASQKVYQERDNGIVGFDIQKAINRVERSVRNREKRREAQASGLLRQIGGAVGGHVYHGYARLAKFLGMPVESAKIRWWNFKHLNSIISYINPGGKVTLEAGNYSVSASIVNKTSVMLAGEGWGTRIVPTSGITVIEASGTESVHKHSMCFKDFFIDGNDLATIGVRAKWVDDTRFQNVKFIDGPASGSPSAFHLHGSSGSYIKGNIIRDCHFENWRDHAGYLGFSYGTEIVHNYVKDCGQVAIPTGSASFYGEYALYTMFANNFCDGSNQTKGLDDAIYLDNDSYYYAVTGNTVRGFYDSGIQINSGRGTVTGNSVYNCGRTGINIAKPEIVCVGNKIEHITEAGAGIGNGIEGDLCSDSVISSNVIKDCVDAGIVLWGYNGGTDDVVIVGNRIRDCAVGVYIETSACVDNMIVANNLKNNTAAITDNGTTTLKANNKT